MGRITTVSTLADGDSDHAAQTMSDMSFTDIKRDSGKPELDQEFVHVAPGIKAVTLMLCSINSIRRLSEKPCSAYLVML